jgi:hypothetical protein
MNKIRFRFFVAGVSLVLAAGGLQAQTSYQTLSFSLVGEYQTNTFVTNNSIRRTNETLVIHPILIDTDHIVKSIAVDLEGTNWLVWNGASLFREVNLTTGAEGIFLRRGTNQTNISAFFDTSFTNNFTGYLGNYIGLVTNGFTNSFTNDSITNSSPTNEALLGGTIYNFGQTNSTTNYLTSAGLYTLSFFSSNVQFNAFGVGSGTLVNVIGDKGGTHYRVPINTEAIGIAGAFYLNTTSNIFDLGTDEGTNLPIYVTGPLHGGISTGPPVFSADIEGP